jgi:methionine sulfoxide reductase heme-binding subunit
MSNIDLWYASRATGIVALVLLTATMLLGITVASRAKSPRARAWLPSFGAAELHKRVSVLTVIFLAVHVVTAIADPYVDIGWFATVVPFASPYHRLWVALGTAGTDLLLAVALSSALRRRLPARTWKALHWLAYLSWPVAVAHTIGMVVACMASVVLATGWRASAVLRARRGRPKTTVAPRPALLLSVLGRTEAAK